MAETRTTSERLQNLCDDLQNIIETVEADDLSRLAKMHGCCEAISGSTDATGEFANDQVHSASADLSKLLESIILGEAEDLDATMMNLRQQVAGLASLVDSCDFDSDVKAEAESSTVTSELNESTVTPVETSESTESDPLASPTECLSPVVDDDAAKSIESNDETTTKGEAALPPATDAAAESEVEETPAYVSEPLIIEAKETEFVAAFVEEAFEHLESIEAGVLGVEQSPDDAEKINDLFRPFHTIKGMAGFLNLRDINSLTHEVETLIDQARKGARSITSGVIDLIFEVVDILKSQISEIDSFVKNPNGDPIPQPPVSEMIGCLRNVVAGKIEPEGREPQSVPTQMKTGEILVEQGAVAKEVVDFALEKKEKSGSEKKTGEMLVEMKAATPKQVSQAIRAQRPAASAGGSGGAQKAKNNTGDQSVRIDTAKLDALVDMVGELVIAQTQVSANPRVQQDVKLSKDASQVHKIVRDVQEVAMAMRMIPIGGTFQKMARLVRDVSRKAGKKVELVISGEDTELDKNVIQQIGDPLVHMVRNAVDHGIESPDERAAIGKSETGQVFLSAFHQGGNIVIEIKDDGRGLDRQSLLKKGIEKGIVSSNEELTDEQVFGLIFAPGFSTAAAVTDISGRGVGMDVVKRNIEQLRGKVEISSEKGAGSTFSICLPLTLAIIDGMIVRCGSERFIIQTILLEQSLKPQRSQITTVQHRGEVLNVRGRLIPLVQLGALFNMSGWVDPCEKMVIIAHAPGGQIGLVVDELIGQQQVVIKTLGERFESLKGISGAAILGDGRVGLILEMAGILDVHNLKQLHISRKKSEDVPTADLMGRDETSSSKQLAEEAVVQDVGGSSEFVETNDDLGQHQKTPLTV